MRAQLKLVPPGPDAPCLAPAPARFDLGVQPTRPGVAYEPVTVKLDPETAIGLSALSAREGLPAGPWAALVVESARSVVLARELFSIDSDQLAEALDIAATASSPESLPVGPGGRLIAYARALRSVAPIDRPSPDEPLTLPVPYSVLVAWRMAAAQAGLELADWALSMLAPLPSERVAWEASAAAVGQTLCEWVLAQAASR